MPAVMMVTQRCYWGLQKCCARAGNSDGTAVVIFQPAEELSGGGREMVNDVADGAV